MTGLMSGLDWPAFNARAGALLQPGDDLARLHELAQAIEAGALTGASRRAARQSEG